MSQSQVFNYRKATGTPSKLSGVGNLEGCRSYSNCGFLYISSWPNHKKYNSFSGTDTLSASPFKRRQDTFTKHCTAGKIGIFIFLSS